MKLTYIRPEFVDFVPKDLVEGVLYISEKYRTASHKCACGCGERVVTPLTPADWQLRKQGNLVTLSPSIGNWNYACQSHYFIRSNQIQWAKPYSKAQIDRVQRKDRADKERYIDGLNHRQENADNIAGASGRRPQSGANDGIWKQITTWWHDLFNS